MTKPSDPAPAERVHDVARMLRAMREGVREALLKHRQAGLPIVVWREGRVVWVPAEEIPLELTTPRDDVE